MTIRKCGSCSGPAYESAIWTCPKCNLIAFQGEPSVGEMPDLPPDISDHDRSVVEAWVKGFRSGYRTHTCLDREAGSSVPRRQQP